MEIKYFIFFLLYKLLVFGIFFEKSFSIQISVHDISRKNEKKSISSEKHFSFCRYIFNVDTYMIVKSCKMNWRHSHELQPTNVT